MAMVASGRQAGCLFSSHVDHEPIAHVARRGIEIEIVAGRSILEALVAANIDFPYSCEEGICGACETKVLSGAPLHRDSVRTPDEHDRRGTVMICCARSRSERLVLDIQGHTPSVGPADGMALLQILVWDRDLRVRGLRGFAQ
jgi:ferredoxin